MRRKEEKCSIFMFIGAEGAEIDYFGYSYIFNLL
jgi:hypothetical protein